MRTNWMDALMEDLAEPLAAALVFDVEDSDGFRIKLENMPDMTPLTAFRITAWRGEDIVLVRVGDNKAERACECALSAIREAGAISSKWSAVMRRARVIDWARMVAMGRKVDRAQLN